MFIERDGELEFVGLWSDVESLNECEALPPEVRILQEEKCRGINCWPILETKPYPNVVCWLVFEQGLLSWTWEPDES